MLGILAKCVYAKKKSLAETLKWVLSYFVYSLLLWISKPKRPRSKPSEKSIAVIFLAAIGDFVVFCGAAEKLKAAGHSITLVCEKSGGIADYAAETRLFEKTVQLDTKGLHRATNIKTLHNIECETVFCAPLGRHILPDIYAFAIRANKRIFADTLLDCSHISLKKRADKLADVLIPVRETNELNRYTSFLNSCGLLTDEVEPFLLDKSHIPVGKTLAIFPGAGGGAEKQWQAERFAYVAEGLAAMGLISSVLILGTAQDARRCEQVNKLLENTCDVENLCGRTQIKDLKGIMKTCTLSLTNDSGSAHISISCGVPTVIVCGMWQYGRFYPNEKLDDIHVAIIADDFKQSCGCSVPCCKSDTAPCVAAVDKDKVLSKAAETLRKWSNY